MSISSPLLIQEPPLQVLPSLAVAIGLEEAIVLQQLHYWLTNPKVGETHDGVRWVYNTYAQWQENFPFWSASGIRKFISRLEEKRLVISTDRFNKDPRDRTKWYTIDYELLAELTNAPAPAGQSSLPPQGSPPAPAGQVFNRTETTSTETTTETSSSPKPKTRRASRIEEPFGIDDATMNWAFSEGFSFQDVAREKDKFVDYHAAKGSTFVDWQRAFKNWLRNSRQFGQPRQAANKPAYYRPNGGLTAEGMAAKARGEIR